ncbi:succinoglycan biosynthesis transport protein [Rhizobium sp. BR 314]|uniref:succinoglycan biosynthesis transport protein n=1 Tax=Rhizobium sp. BR 314 TaxID=3040013 RepID=UPI0039BF749E
MSDRGGDFQAYADLRAANSDDPRDAELRAILRRRLNGDPYPVSGGKPLRAEAMPQAKPLAQQIGTILGHRYGENEPAVKPQLEPVADLLEFVPDLLVGEAALLPEFAEPAAPLVLPRRRNWSLSIGSLGFVTATALAGAAIPTLFAPPPAYVSQAFLHAEGEGRARQSVLNIAARRAVAPAALSDVVARLRLDRDPEFTGTRAGALGVAMELLSGNGGASDAPSRAQATLRKGIAVGVDDSTGLLRLTVTSGDPGRSADIANRLVVATIYDAAVVQAAAAPRAGDTSADRSRKELDRVTAALAEFKAEYGEDKIAAALKLQDQRRQLDSEIKAVDLAVRTARANVAAARSATPTSLLSGALPADLTSASLDDLRSRYSAAKAQLTQLATQLGPRHPRLLAQQATVDDLGANLRAQLQRLVTSSDAALKAALDKQAALSAQMTALSKNSMDVDIARLGQLRDAVAAAQSRFDADQQNAALAPQEVRPPMTVISQAVAAAAPIDDHLASNQATGFLVGLGLSLGLVFLRKWLASATENEDREIGHAAAQVPAPQYHIEPLPAQSPGAIREDIVEPIADIDTTNATSGEWLRVQQELAELRSKVETYAARRQTERD